MKKDFLDKMPLTNIVIEPVGSQINLGGINRDPLTKLGFRKVGYCTFEQVIEEATKGNSEEGYFSKVYLIPRIDQYVLKVYKYKEEDPNAKLELIKDPLPDKNISQVIAHKGRYEILKRQHGVTGGVPFYYYIHPNEEGDKKYRGYIHMVASMPQSAFNHLAEIMITLHNIDYRFDWFSGRNLVFDTEHNEINVVDTDNLCTYPPAINIMLPPLFDTLYTTHTSAKFYDLVEPMNRIIDRAITATLDKGLYITPLGYIPPWSNKEHNAHANMEYVFELAGRTGEWLDTRKKLLELGVKEFKSFVNQCEIY